MTIASRLTGVVRRESIASQANLGGVVKHRHTAILAIATTMFCATADAQTMPKRKPGLWEAQMTTSAGNMPNMAEQLANLPPEQRAQMEAMMKQHGVTFGAGGSATSSTTIRYCLSEKQAADESGKELLTNIQHGANCDHKIVSRTTTEIRVHAVCKTERGPSEFDVRVYDITPVSLSMQMDGKSPDHGDMHMQQKARWVGADCGTVK